MESTYICLLPSEKDTARLHHVLKSLLSTHTFAKIKLPLHVTLHFFPAISDQDRISAMNWIQNMGSTIGGPILAATEHVRSFGKGSHDFVYYLPVSSHKIIHLHDELNRTFKHANNDPFDFIPHISLFYPDRNLGDDEKNSAQILFKDIENLSFDRLAFAKEENNRTHFINVQNL